jgi:hypothetical protein
MSVEFDSTRFVTEFREELTRAFDLVQSRFFTENPDETFAPGNVVVAICLAGLDFSMKRGTDPRLYAVWLRKMAAQLEAEIQTKSGIFAEKSGA